MSGSIVKTTVLRPRVSEKSYGLSEALNVYVFEVAAGINKHEIASAVATQFDVTVTSVNVSNLKGKAKRTIYKRSRPVAGRQNSVRKAYVTLQQGDSIAVFKTEDDAEAKPVKRGKK